LSEDDTRDAPLAIETGGATKDDRELPASLYAAPTAHISLQHFSRSSQSTPRREIDRLRHNRSVGLTPSRPNAVFHSARAIECRWTGQPATDRNRHGRCHLSPHPSGAGHL